MSVDLSLFNQLEFRFRNDDGSQTTATWRQALNTNDSWRVTTGLRVRFTMLELGGGGSTSKTFTLYYSKNSGSYTAVGASTPIQFSLSSNFANNDNTTQQISVGGTYVATNLGMQETTGGITNTVPASNQFEAEWCLIIDAAQVADGDTFDLRVYKTSSPVNTYTQTPRITVSTTIAKFAATTTWVCPTGVTSLTTVECYGGGGSGGTGDSGSLVGGTGGGGGAYSSSTSYSVTPGSSYTVTVGTGGAQKGPSLANGSAGGDSWFESTSGVLAKGGSGGGYTSSTGTGGASGSGVGGTKYSGGNGTSNYGVGGGSGGGGGAGNANSGSNSSVSPSTGGTGGSANGGNGGDGSTLVGRAPAGSTFGGGGGGGDYINLLSGAGADGAVWLTYSNPVVAIPNKIYNIRQAVKRASFY